MVKVQSFIVEMKIKLDGSKEVMGAPPNSGLLSE